MIHANHRDDKVIDYLLQKLKGTQNEVVLHGCCLGLGVCALGTHSMDLFNQMKTVLFNDSAVAGEAAGIGMGLVMIGSGNRECIDEMLQYAHDTQHEKIVRGLAIGMGLIMYAQVCFPFAKNVCRKRKLMI
jgi:26S proteasome regulatory subunit N2